MATKGIHILGLPIGASTYVGLKTFYPEDAQEVAARIVAQVRSVFEGAAPSSFLTAPSKVILAGDCVINITSFAAIDVQVFTKQTRAILDDI